MDTSITNLVLLLATAGGVSTNQSRGFLRGFQRVKMTESEWSWAVWHLPVEWLHHMRKVASQPNSGMLSIHKMVPELKIEDTRSETSSPIIRVCDSPESSSGSPTSPLSASFYSSSGSTLSSPPPIHHIPNPFLFRPFFNMPLPLLPLPQPSPPSSKPLTFSIDNILRSNFHAAGLERKPTLSPSIAPKQTPLPKPVKAPPPPKPKVDIEIPVDLSKTSNEAPKTDADCPPGKKIKNKELNILQKFIYILYLRWNR